jgi:hypothetical protein
MNILCVLVIPVKQLQNSEQDLESVISNEIKKKPNYFYSLLSLLTAGLLMKFQRNAKSIMHEYKNTCIKSIIMHAVGLQRNM